MPIRFPQRRMLTSILTYKAGVCAGVCRVCRLLTFGDRPVVAVEQLDAEGQQLLQQGLQPPALPAAAGGAQQLTQQVGDLGLGGEAAVVEQTGVEPRVPKEIQRLVHFLEVGGGL